MNNHKKIPEIGEAIQWTGHAHSTTMIDVFMEQFPKESKITGSRLQGNATLIITTPSGIIELSEGDWLVKTKEGEYYAASVFPVFKDMTIDDHLARIEGLKQQYATLDKDQKSV